MNSGLFFYNLAVNMNFNLVKDPGYRLLPIRQPTVHSNLPRKIRHSILHLVPVHDQSLYPNFPLTITALTSSTAGTTTDQGYVNIELPVTAEFGALGADWYGLVCTLNLGSMGALASLAGFHRQTPHCLERLYYHAGCCAGHPSARHRRRQGLFLRKRLAAKHRCLHFGYGLRPLHQAQRYTRCGCGSIRP